MPQNRLVIYTNIHLLKTFFLWYVYQKELPCTTYWKWTQISTKDFISESDWKKNSCIGSDIVETAFIVSLYSNAAWMLQTNRKLSKLISYKRCTIASKINGTPKGVYLRNSKLHSILAVANLLAHNNKSRTRCRPSKGRWCIPDVIIWCMLRPTWMYMDSMIAPINVHSIS